MKYNVIKIPHLDYTIVVLNKTKDDMPETYAYTEHVGKGEVKVVIPLPIGKKRCSMLVHEIIHVLQYISQDRSMRFLYEEEHFAYLADWLFKEIIKL